MNTPRVAAATLLLLLAPLGGQVSVLALSLIVAALLLALAVWELRRPAARSEPSLPSTGTVPS
jgi:predicted membrane metal-binding protein